MTDLPIGLNHASELGIQVASLTLLKEAVERELETARAELQKEMDYFDAESVDVGLIDSADPLGNASISTRTTPVVLDEDALLAYVQEEYPSRIKTVKVIDPEWKKQFLAGLDYCTETSAYDVQTGHFIDGVRISNKRIMTFRYKKHGRETLAELFKSGDLSVNGLIKSYEQPSVEK